MPQLVCIGCSDFGLAKSLAAQTFERFQNMRGHYDNTANSHLRGKIGEIACARWLESQGIVPDSAFEDLGRVSEADLIVGSSPRFRLDVKTWDDRYWTTMGRCVAVKQIRRLEAKADGVIWCITPSVLTPDVQVSIAGWNTVDDIQRAPRRMTGPVGKRQVDNHQVDVEAVRPLSELRAMLS